MSDETLAFKMQLKPGVVPEYQRRHDELWPDLAEALREAGIHDYWIFLDEATLSLFAVLKRKPGFPFDELPLQPVMRRWWDYMADLMEVEPDNRPRQWPLKPLFHFN
ncbi:L-rhamnose mutarotase [Pelomonas sp. Root1217]|uniref:L-rhamnose mutarotase n=1 Tax=Pelomonas sp. Root1217 TaxID=1736430 RepID=UPI00070EAAC1|nr:L-rhamnose mutarotase [Pelomonas sp. Root1217]KQV61148.1 L-rhamnose mutarotase [Pelomonas sp. Root1217]